MSKRPLCVLAAGFLLIQVFRLWQMEPEPEQALLRQLGKKEVRSYVAEPFSAGKNEGMEPSVMN